ncbi:MAG: phage tail assembly protein [Zoogloeaceae bacterium]|jgi:hypothetical protein|nr:phage tail assembly protein [Zoogloeaceae bacterium]
MKLTLKHPLTLGKTTVEALTFRDYTTAADYLAFDVKGGVAQNIALIANLTGTDEALIKQLRGADYLAAQRIADRLLLTDSEAVAEGETTEKKPAAS